MYTHPANYVPKNRCWHTSRFISVGYLAIVLAATSICYHIQHVLGYVCRVLALARLCQHVRSHAHIFWHMPRLL